jgi:hypothetical protein
MFIEEGRYSKLYNQEEDFSGGKGMKVLNLSTRVAGNIKTTDSQSGYSAYSRRAIEMIRNISFKSFKNVTKLWKSCFGLNLF